jgi:hypothetical protein
MLLPPESMFYSSSSSSSYGPLHKRLDRVSLSIISENIFYHEKTLGMKKLIISLLWIDEISKQYISFSIT